MDLINGKYKMVSQKGMEAVIKDAGLPEDACKLVLDPSNETTITCTYNNGLFCFMEEHSKAPMFDITTSAKLGEESEFTFLGIKTTYTLSKKSDDCFIVKSSSKEQGNATSEYTFNNFGLLLQATLHDKGLCFSGIYERCKPCVDGYYMFEKEEGTDEYMAKVYPDIDMTVAKKAMNFGSLKVSTCGDTMTMDEYFGDSIPPKNVTFKLDQEFRYQLEAFQMDLNLMMTSTGPGTYTCVSKNNKTGGVQDLSWVFSQNGTTFTSKDVSSGLKMTHWMKRTPDFLGTFKLVTHTSMTSYFDALGMPASARSSLIPPAGMRMTMTRVGDDMYSATSTSDMFPDAIFRFGEEFSFTAPVPGGAPITAKCMNTMTETGNIEVVKMGDKVIVIKSDITGDFLISTAEVEGHPYSKMKMIFIRC